ncbi:MULTISPECIES: putative bacteriocin export ABC transporter [Streptococcus]|jgi:putative bacteriocin ABC transporter|uniref:putative bacteriocin export ABC transporter n=1 Tax=Streptococcus TaxID=1301 RepID=UPI001D7C281C|nr:MULTISPECIES: putative bacteriocin export ABC transporter [unclassified Streptococcus]MBS6987108.1 putative bacteriocin export ABC transporter [Streptococcus parasanguinis]MCP8963854.1 putative bacteriocin export ABC transporter [Streptococcus sp. CF8_St5-12]MCP8981758.1 putative bacteriocin export ABC transporter [Streptococcus sp. CF8_St5-16]MCP8983130.1 putative bacteriocin export ABC transporter [Streptococcus sp. CF8_St5-13]MCP9040606.1 putative bacteriocin export ABC transporter [Stre
MIELRNINKGFDDRIVLENLNYNFYEGNSYALIGASGAGKTTLLNIIGKLEEVDSGDIIVNDINLNNIKEKDYFKNYLSYLFQNFGLIENKSIQENLMLAFIGEKISKLEMQKKMNEALKRVHLDVNLNRKIYTLSGGEAQRVALAKTILKDSPIILADEPTASVDQKNSEEIIELILSLKKENKIIIIATHSPDIYNQVDHILEIKGEQK